MSKNLLLRLSGIIAIGTAIYHGVSADNILTSITALSADQLGTIRALVQLGTMGWVFGGILLIGAASLLSHRARNWIVGVLGVMYGFPALGTLTLSGGEINLGGTLLALVVVFALLGRKLQSA